MTMTPEVAAKVDDLPNRQRIAFDGLMREAHKNPIAAEQDIRSRLAEGAIAPADRPAAILALVEIAARTSNRPKTVFTPEETAMADVRDQIAKAEADGDTATAEHLQGIVDRIKSRAEKDLQRQQEVQQQSYERMTQQQDELIASYERQFADAKSAAISTYTAAKMTPQQAERQFEQTDRPHVEAHLKRSLGI